MPLFFGPKGLLSGDPINTTTGGASSSSPVAKGRVFNTAYTAGNDVFGADLSTTDTPTVFRITVDYSVATTITLAVKNGGTTLTPTLNAGANLVADSVYVFEVGVRSNETYNIRFGATGTIRYLYVDEFTTASI